MRSLRIQLAVCIGLAAFIRIAAYDIGPIQRLDVKLLAHITRPADQIHHISELLVTPFDWGLYLVIVAIVFGAAAIRGRARVAAIAVAAMFAAALTTQVLKHLLAQPRPQAASLNLAPDAWPSGHSTAATALVIGILLITPPRHRRPVAIAGAAVVVIVGMALLILGRHYPSDVAGGVCIAAAWGAVAWHLSERSRAVTRS